MTKELTFLGRFMESNPGWLSARVVRPDFTRSMTVVRYDWGYVIETEHVDEEGIVTLEVLTTINGQTAALISRERCGDNYNEMKSYLRDGRFPVGCVVKLCKIPS